MADERVPSSKLARAQILGAAALDSGFMRLKYALRSGAGASAEEQAARDEEIAKRVFQALGQLRGTALKVSQMLANEQDLLPEAVRRELARASYRAPALNRAVARRIVQAELGASPERLFERFETEPFAAASLGQVHRVIARGSGRELALKVQYPGIAEAIDSDMELVRGLLAALRPLSGSRPEFDGLNKMLREVETRLHEEVDYTREARATAWFHAHLRHPQLAIPELVPEYCSARVLTTTLLRGDHLDRWLAKQPPKHEIDRLGQVLCEVFFASMFELRRVHTDPNPGNYLFLPDGRLGLLDFGCTDEVAPLVASFFGLCTRAYMERDLDAAITQYQRMGLIAPELSAAQRSDYHERMQPSCEWVAAALGAERVDFAAQRGIIAKMREAVLRLGPALSAHGRPLNSASVALDEPAPDMLFLSRAFVGLFRILLAMGAEVEMRRLVPSSAALVALGARAPEEA